MRGRLLPWRKSETLGGSNQESNLDPSVPNTGGYHCNIGSRKGPDRESNTDRVLPGHAGYHCNIGPKGLASGRVELPSPELQSGVLPLNYEAFPMGGRSVKMLCDGWVHVMVNLATHTQMEGRRWTSRRHRCYAGHETHPAQVKQIKSHIL